MSAYRRGIGYCFGPLFRKQTASTLFRQEILCSARQAGRTNRKWTAVSFTLRDKYVPVLGTAPCPVHNSDNLHSPTSNVGQPFISAAKSNEISLTSHHRMVSFVSSYYIKMYKFSNLWSREFTRKDIYFPTTVIMHFRAIVRHHIAIAQKYTYILTSSTTSRNLFILARARLFNSSTF